MRIGPYTKVLLVKLPSSSIKNSLTHYQHFFFANRRMVLHKQLNNIHTLTSNTIIQKFGVIMIWQFLMLTKVVYLIKNDSKSSNIEKYYICFLF